MSHSSLSQITMFLTDLLAVSVLVFGLYFPRHRRRDLVVAYLGVNVGVLAVASTLESSSAGAGLGLGLFGVLSIIRLRSTQLDQHEVAYYFSALAMGILGGMQGAPVWRSVSMLVLILVVMAVGDHSRLLGDYRRQLVVLDSAYTDEVALIAHLEQLLGGRVHSVGVEQVNLVNETTLVDVRYSIRPRTAVVLESGGGTLARTGVGR
jgi:hypothetical protein